MNIYDYNLLSPCMQKAKYYAILSIIFCMLVQFCPFQQHNCFVQISCNKITYSVVVLTLQ